MVGMYTHCTATAICVVLAYSVTAIFLELLVFASAEAATEEAYVTVARCRIQCFKKVSVSIEACIVCLATDN